MQLGLAIGAVVAIRLAVLLVMPQPVQSDAAAYFAMAESLAAGGPMRDMFGQIAFYSPGYPLILAPFFALLGSHVGVARAVNLVLAAITALLLHRLTLRLSGSRTAALLAVLGYAIWLPSLLAAATLAKENLSTPLLLAFLLATLAVVEGKQIARAAFIAGLCFGGGLLAGASSLLTVTALVVVLWMRRRVPIAKAASAFVAAALLVTGPWLTHTATHFGQPTLATNGGFNLYLGNNPAATGAFVSIADTPAGPRWEAMRETLGEAGSASALGREAQAWALANPARVAELAALKLAWFWAPNVPDARETATLRDAIIRWGDVGQHVLILGFGLVGLWLIRARPEAMPVAVLITSFWALHALAYVMVRYREPVMPILIALAASALTRLIAPRRPSR